jgi:hypothetical protein
MDAQVNTRRTDPSAVSGCVTFPVEGQEYENTKLGGMYVQLVAIERRSEAENWWDDAFLVCFGGSNTVLDYQELLAGTDTLKDTLVPYSEKVEDTWNADRAKVADATNLLFPSFFSEKKVKGQYQSVPVLTAITLGSTGATWMKDNVDYWRCTYEDLDLQGKALYDSIKQLYGEKADLHLITWVDEG